MVFTYAFAGVPVADYDSALAWYERLLGRPPDLVPNDRESAWQLTGTGWIYVVEDHERAGKALITLLADNLEDHVADLEERELATGIEAVPGVGRKAVVTDPEGNMITFAEPLSADD